MAAAAERGHHRGMVPINPRFRLGAFAVALVVGGASALVFGLPPGLGWGMLLIALALGSAVMPGRTDHS
jgi:hypothetical protein